MENNSKIETKWNKIQLWTLDYTVSLFVGYKHCELVISCFFFSSLVEATYTDWLHNSSQNQPLKHNILLINYNHRISSDSATSFPFMKVFFRLYMK